ncbi:MAG: SRPBCC family protein [archaeon]
MTRVTGSRTVAASPAAVRSIIQRNLGAFVGAGGFDSVDVEGDTFAVTRDLGLATIELTARVDQDADGVLAYEAIDGIFEHMRTEYAVDPAESGAKITAVTEFSLGGIFGSALDATLVSTQRKREFEDQFDYLESQLEADGIVS